MSRSNRQPTVGFWVAAGLCFFGVSQASAAPTSSPENAPTAVTLLPLLPGPGVSERTAQKLTSLWEENLQSREDDFFMFSAPESVQSAAQRQDESGEWLEDGKEALAAVAFDDAATKFRKAIDAVWKDPASSADNTLVEGYLYLAIAELRRGDEKAARAALAGLLRIKPSFELPKNQFPPVLARELDKARKTWAHVAKKSITVEGPEGARAFVNGTEIGMVPETQGNLATGLHLVRVETTDGGRTTSVVEIGSEDVKAKAPFPVATPVTHETLVNFHGRLDTVLASELSAYIQENDGDGAIVGVVERVSESNELKLVSAVYVRKRNAFALLPPVFVGVDLISANTDIYQLTEGVRRQMRQFGPPVALPHLLLPQATVALSSPSSLAPSTTASRSPLALNPEMSMPDLTAEQPSAMASNRAPISPVPLQASPVLQTAKGVPWWVWVVGGVGVAAAAGGTVYGISTAARPVSGTVTARW